MADDLRVTRVGDGMYRVERAGRGEIVYVAGTGSGAWAFWNGQVFRGEPARDQAPPRRTARGEAVQALAAPMPATVIKVLVEPGAKVKKGDTVIVLEAMKMELPIRATSDATVIAVNCREGEMVQPDVALIELA